MKLLAVISLIAAAFLGQSVTLSLRFEVVSVKHRFAILAGYGGSSPAHYHVESGFNPIAEPAQEDSEN